MKQLLSILTVLSLVSPFSSAALAQSGSAKVRKQTTTIITKESESDVDDEDVKDEPVAEPRESVKTVTFGSKNQSGTAGCKTEALAKPLIKDLKADCNAWVKDQKSELKARFQTSSCEESCSDCGMSLQRCNVVGTVHYIVK